MKTAHDFYDDDKTPIENMIAFAKECVEDFGMKIIESSQKVYQVSPLSDNKLIGQSEIAQIGENYLKTIR